jgi:hypothetical protein
VKFLDALRPTVRRSTTYSMDAWAAELYQRMLFEGNQYPLGFTTTYGRDPAEPIGESFAGYVQGGLKSNGIVFALELKRLQVFSQARFQYQRMREGRPGDLFGDRALTLLERPWMGGTTGDLLSRMLMDADFAGNAFNTVLDGEVVRLRPDWVEIVLEPRTLDQGASVQVGWRQVGILYYEGGVRSGNVPAVFLAGQYSHFAPVPDPEATYRGMSWLTPVIRELQADTSATKHKLKFFENAATPNLAVSLAKEITPEQFKAFVAEMDKQHQGADNAYKTLYTAGGADVTVIGQNMQQLDFKVTQGAGETRLAAAAGVHPVIAGLSEGMQGSSLNAGNYTAAKRAFVDTTCRHLWQNAAGSLEALVPAPEDSRLWYDARDIPFLLDDMKDRAEIQASQAQTIRTLGDAGYTSDSIKAAVLAEDWSLLQHSGLFSVQLQPPGTTAQPETPEAGRAEARRHLPGRHNQDSHGDGTGGAAKRLGRMTEDEFFESHGEDWFDQYGSSSGVDAILWKTGEASIYSQTRDTVNLFADVDSGGARRLASSIEWAVGHPESRPDGTKTGLVESRATDLGPVSAQVGYGYDREDALFVRVEFPKVGNARKPTVLDLVDLEAVESLVGDLRIMADAIDSKAYEGPTPGVSRRELLPTARPDDIADPAEEAR